MNTTERHLDWDRLWQDGYIAYQRGYNDGPDYCPHTLNAADRAHWLAGFEAAKEHHREEEALRGF